MIRSRPERKRNRGPANIKASIGVAFDRTPALRQSFRRANESIRAIVKTTARVSMSVRAGDCTGKVI
ncbi:MAG TPA: hypothetical protein VF666_20420 [Pyrinomonadaceae bacterium]